MRAPAVSHCLVALATALAACGDNLHPTEAVVDASPVDAPATSCTSDGATGPCAGPLQLGGLRARWARSLEHDS